MPLFDISFRCPTIRVVSITPRRRNRQSKRLCDYDYTTAGAYFVTVCTQERQCSLEDPVWRSVVRTAWRRAVCGGTEPSPYDFVIMPNHVHGIAWLPAGARRRPTVVGTQRLGNDGLVVSGVALVGERRSDIGCAAPLRARLKAGSLGAVVRAFKSASTIRINRVRGTPGGAVWQRSYHDRVIRDEAELARVRQYILDNPLKWDEDRNNPHDSARSRMLSGSAARPRAL